MGKFNSLGLIIIAGALFFLFTKPQMADIDALNQRKEAYNQAISDMRQIDQKKNELLAKLNSFPAEDIAKVDTLLPDKPDIVKLVSEMEGIASKYGINLVNISTNSSNFSASVGGEAQSKGYESTNVSFDFDANYDDMKKLLTEIESSLRIVDIRSIDIKGGTGSQFSYNVSLEIYWVSAKQSQAQLTPVITPI